MDNIFLTWTDIQNQANNFGFRLDQALEEIGIKSVCKGLAICHVCVRIKNSENVTQLKNTLTDVGEVISSVPVNGREISIIQLFSPLNISSWEIKNIELPYPKPNHSYNDGLEHVEFVFDGIQNTMDGVRERLLEIINPINISKLKESYSYSEDEPQAESDQKPNPTILIKVNGIGIKFHALPIQEVVGFIA